MPLTFAAKLFSAVLMALLALAPISAWADDANEIDLKLFGDNVIEGWNGCRFGVWQANRDPKEDRYAYVMFAPIPDGEALPAWIKIGDEVMEVSQVDIGSADTGLLAPFLLYRTFDRKTTVMVEILDQSRGDHGIEIHDARLTFLQKDKFPFPIRVKGLNGCPQENFVAHSSDEQGSNPPPPTSSGNEVSLGGPVPYDSLDQVPGAVRRAIAEQAPECEPENTPGFSTAYSISDALTLWEVSCNLYAASGSSVFVLSWTYAPDVASVMLFPGAPGEGINDYAEQLNPTVEPAAGTVITYSLDSGGDCGSFRRFQLVFAEGETVEAELIEFRDKPNCDGVQSDPSKFPLVYSK